MSGGADPRVTVVVPVRDTPLPLLRRCVTSILDSARRARGVDTEVVLVDDASAPRHFARYTRELGELSPELRIVRRTRWGGIGSARNRGAREARGEWLLFADSDDRLRGATIGALAARARGADVVAADHIVRLPGRSVHCRKAPFFRLLHPRRPQDSPLLYCNFLKFPALVRRRTFAAVGGYREDFHSGEHVALWFDLHAAGASFRHVEAALYDYFVHPESNSGRNPSRHVEGKKRVLIGLAERAGVDCDDFLRVPGAGSLPPLYVPLQRGRTLPPNWAEVRASCWRLRASGSGERRERERTAKARSPEDS